MKCPKCGFDSNDSQTCESCGASLSKIRSREIEASESTVEDRTKPWVAPGESSLARNLWYLVIVIILGALAWYQAHQRAKNENPPEESLEAPAETSEFRGFRNGSTQVAMDFVTEPAETALLNPLT